MDDYQRARELLALGLDEYGHHAEAANVRKGIDLEFYRTELWSITAALRAAPEGSSQQLPVSLWDLLHYTKHVILCSDDGEDYACPRPMIDAMTTMGILRKVGRGKWSVNMTEATAVVSSLAARPQGVK